MKTRIVKRVPNRMGKLIRLHPAVHAAVKRRVTLAHLQGEDETIQNWIADAIDQRLRNEPLKVRMEAVPGHYAHDEEGSIPEGGDSDERPGEGE